MLVTCYGAVLVRGSKGHGGHCLHFIVIGGHCPPLPPSPLFCMMYKSINGGGSGGGGGGSAIHHPKISESGPQPIDTLIYLYTPTFKYLPTHLMVALCV